MQKLCYGIDVQPKKYRNSAGKRRNFALFAVPGLLTQGGTRMKSLTQHADSINRLLSRYGVKFGIYKDNTFHE